MAHSSLPVMIVILETMIHLKIVFEMQEEFVLLQKLVPIRGPELGQNRAADLVSTGKFLLQGMLI